MTTAKKAREALEEAIIDYGMECAIGDASTPDPWPRKPIDAYAADVERETEARVKAEIAAHLRRVAPDRVSQSDIGSVRLCGWLDAAGEVEKL